MGKLEPKECGVPFTVTGEEAVRYVLEDIARFEKRVALKLQEYLEMWDEKEDSDE